MIKGTSIAASSMVLVLLTACTAGAGKARC